MKDHTYYYNEVVIGNTLKSAIYAYENNCYYIYNLSDAGFPLDITEKEITLRDLYFPAGSSVNKVKSEIIYNITLRGLSSVSGKIQSIRISETDLKVVTKNSRSVKIGFNKLRIFSLDKVSSAPFNIRESAEMYRVLDWFSVRSGTKHDYEALYDEDNSFVNKIYFYPSKRIDGNTFKYKDLVSESWLATEQLNDVNYSDSISRLKILDMMKSAGINGTGNGKDSRGKQRYLPIKIELEKRDVFPIKKIVHDNSSSNIVMDFDL